jgi:secreted PhoX family phosphatase
MLENPDNVVIVPQTGDIFLQEDSDGEQFVRGVTRAGEIYDFAKSGTNESEFCGACFDPDHRTLYVNQQGNRGSLPFGPPGDAAVTYAIYGPFERRAGSNGR